jgi:hypothetical protein
MDCQAQAAILAYALRVNPVLARPRIGNALAIRDVTGCYGELLISIADIYYDPILEDLACRSLDDPAPRVRTTSIRLLGRFGSPAMEAVLFERYSKWLENRWGRELEVTPAFADNGAQRDAINESANLLDALTTATSWVTGQDKLLKLLSMTQVPRLRQDLEFKMNAWRELTITFNTVPGSTRINGHVAQYEFQSMQAFEDKLTQFPPGTKFVVRSGQDTPAARDAIRAVNSFLRAHGMIVVATQ